MPGQNKSTHNHEEIRRWVEERGGKPARVRGTGSAEHALQEGAEELGDPGLLRIDFPGYAGSESLEDINWEDFFRKFDEEHLEMIYQEETAEGQKSRFCKFVRRGSKGRGRKAA